MRQVLGATNRVNDVEELYALFLAHFVVRLLQCRLPECDASLSESFVTWYNVLLWELGRLNTAIRLH